MDFCYNKEENLPRLSWLAVLKKADPQVQIFHGPWVENRQHFFVEGIWDSSFEKGLIDKSCILMGSGGRIEGDEVVFSTPCHTTERLYCVRKGEFLWVSNSIGFILKRSDCSVDMNYLHYVSDFGSISKGIDEYVKQIPLKGNLCMQMVYFRNLQINVNLEISEYKKPLPPIFNTYSEYKGFLIDGLKRLSENAQNKGRLIKYSPVSTISTGYDSVASAALGLEIDCKLGMTVSGPGKYVQDCGAAVGQSLGYENIIEVSGNAYKKRSDLLEALFMASGELGTDCFWSSFEDHLPGTFVLSGVHGDKVWDVNNKVITNKIKRSSPAATSLTEFRLRIGFFQVPIPFLGCIRHNIIQRISESKEMLPWRLNNGYDRPIPRRIAEEHGAKREQFGFKKIGAGFNMQWYPLFRIKKTLSKSAYKSFVRFYKKNSCERSLLKVIFQGLLYMFFLSPILANVLLSKLGFKFEIKRIKLPQRFSDNPFASSYLFPWGVEVTKKQY
jgi:hypothetical protein